MAKLLGNTGWLLGGRLVSQALALVLTVIVARYLGEAGLGQFAFISAVGYVGNVASTFGLDTWLIREVAGTPTPNYPILIRTALLIQLVLSALFLLGVNLVVPFLPHQTPETTLALQIFTLSLIPLAFSTIHSAIWRGREQMNRFVLLQLLTHLCQTGGAYWLLWQGGGLVALASWLLVVSCGAAFIGHWLLTYQQPMPNYPLPSPTTSYPLRELAPLALLMVVAVLYQRVGLFAFSWLTTDAVTGWYSAGTRLVEVGKFIPQAFLGAIFPVMARRSYIYNKEMKKWLLGISAIEIFFLVLAASWLVSWLYEENYAPAIPVVQLLAVTLLPFALTSVHSFELVSQRREKTAFLAQLLALLVAIPLLWFGIQQGGLLGGCVALLGSEMVYAAILVWLS